jgi:hypothetical protein
VKRPPDFVIGPAEHPYLLRWWIIPRNRFFNIYLHKMLRDDDDRALHDHPWLNLSIILRGGYKEITRGKDGGLVAKIRRAGAFVLRMPTCAHRLELIRLRGGYNYSWSLFITGPVVRTWGFHCPKGWVPWREFVDERDTGQIGRGCGEHS